MRILITADIFPPDVGGPATYVPRIASCLTRRGHEVWVLTYSRCPAAPLPVQYPFDVVRTPLALPQWRRFPRAVGAVLSMGRDADVVYANGLISEVALANRFLRKPVVAKVVGDIAWERCRDKGWVDDDLETFQTRKYGLAVEMMRWRRTLSCRAARIVLTPSVYLQRLVAQHWRLRRVRVIYNSFERPAPPPGTIQIDLPAQFKLITVCRLVSWKGVDGLIDLLPDLPHVGLVVVGDGPMRNELETRAERLGVRSRVLFTGTLPPDRVPSYLASCDVFVLNSTYEGLPHVVLEALAAGIPVVATDVGGTGEIIESGTNGWLIPPGNTARLREAVRQMLQNPAERSRLVAAGQSTLARFSLQRMVEETERALQEAMETGP